MEMVEKIGDAQQASGPQQKEEPFLFDPVA
jgi:hypothetical protein